MANEKSFNDRVIVYLTGGLLIAALLQFCTMKGQQNVMQGQLDAMEADQRPWVFATPAQALSPIYFDEKGGHVLIEHTLKNTGRTPGALCRNKRLVFLAFRHH
jgi:hypothetical protein